MRDTSRLAYQDIKPKLGELQQTILILVHGNPDHTDKELAQIAGKSDPADIRRRRGELVDMGYVVSSGKRICTVSGKLCHVWRVKR